MAVSTFICLLIGLIILLASNEDISNLKAQQLVARRTLYEYRLKHKRNKRNDNNTN